VDDHVGRQILIYVRLDISFVIHLFTKCRVQLTGSILTSALVAAVALLVPVLLAVAVALVLVGFAEDAERHRSAHLGASDPSAGLGCAGGVGGGLVHG
jgi:hypothetical protein